jgi:hypothetical protein
MIHDPYYCQQRAPRVRPRTSINSPALPSIITRRCRTKHPGPGDIPPCNVTALSEAILEGKVTTPINHHKLHFLAWLQLLSSASTSTWLARSAILEFQIPEGPLLDSNACNVLYQWPQALNRNINQTCRIRGTQQRKLQQLSRILYHALTASWHTVP